MDSFDKKILDIVQRNNQLSTEKIADLVGLSGSAVQRRLKRLRKDKIIEADVAIISPQAAGQRLLVIVEITLEPERPLSLALENFKKQMLETPEVMQCYHVTGNADFILVIGVRDMDEYETLTRRLFSENRSVKRFQTSVVVNRVKSGSIVPLTDE